MVYDPNTFISDYEVIPEGWPKNSIPKNVLIPPQNIIIAWVAGLASTEKVMNYYKKEKTGPILLVDRRHGFQTPNITSLIALTIFLCKSINVHYNPGFHLGNTIHQLVVKNI